MATNTSETSVSTTSADPGNTSRSDLLRLPLLTQPEQLGDEHRSQARGTGSCSQVDECDQPIAEGAAPICQMRRRGHIEPPSPRREDGPDAGGEAHYATAPGRRSESGSGPPQPQKDERGNHDNDRAHADVDAMLGGERVQTPAQRAQPLFDLGKAQCNRWHIVVAAPAAWAE